MKLEAARFMTAYKTGDKPYWLSLLGNSGTGKTFLADLMGCDINPWYEVIGWLRNDDKKQQAQFMELATERYYDKWEGRWTNWKNPDPRCIDDIGSEYVTDFSRSKLCEFMNRREGKWTVITANMSLEQIGKELDERIASRMLRHGSVVVEVDVPDYNLR